MEARSSSKRFLALVVAGAGLSCAGGPPPSTGDTLAALDAQLERGGSLYRHRCYDCHDVEGATGAELSDRVVASYHTARSLFDYIRMAMPLDAAGSLSDDEYWAVTAHLITQRRVAVLNGPLGGRVGDSLFLMTDRE